MAEKYALYLTAFRKNILDFQRFDLTDWEINF